MKIIVCIKQVPDTSGKVAIKPDGALNRASMYTITTPRRYETVEAALIVKKSRKGQRVWQIPGTAMVPGISMCGRRDMNR